MSENLNTLYSPVLVVEALTADKTLDVYDTGKLFTIDASSAIEITLPLASALTGWHATFVLKATGDAGTIVTSGSENVIVGHVIAIDADGDAIAVTNDADADTITFVNGCTLGSRVHIYSDGSNFYVEGFGSHASASDKLTLTKAS
jgi:hypothetical protein